MRIKYTGKYGEIIDRETLTTGSVGLIIHIETDADWSSLTLTAQFYNGGVPLNQLVFGGTVELPMEMVRATKPVSMVLIGRNQDGTQVQTSVELPLGNVWYGLREGAEAPDRPTPDWQAQIEAGVDNAVSTAAAVEERANNGEFDGGYYVVSATADGQYLVLTWTPSVADMPTIPEQRVLIDIPGASTEEIAQAVADYLTAHPVEAPVTSVNSKTGAVVLTAEDVEAVGIDQLPAAINQALAQARDSGLFDGQDGHTPQKGVDYWTAEDQQAIVTDVLAALPPVPTYIRGEEMRF